MNSLSKIKQHKLFIAVCIFFMFSFGPSSSKFDGYTYIYFSSSNLSLDYMKQGVLCSGIYKGKYFCKFYETKKIPLDKRNAIQRYIKRERLWNLDTSYKNEFTILGSLPQIFILNNPHDYIYKKITINGCYNPKIDSLIIYLNDLLPNSEKKRMNLLDFRIVQSEVFPNCK